MEKILRILFCLAVFTFLQAQSFSLREKVPRYFPRPHLQEMIHRAIQYKRAGHFFNQRDESECKDLNEDCPFMVDEYSKLEEGSYDFCGDNDEEIQNYVKTYCRKTCNFCTDESEPKPPAPPLKEISCEDDNDCRELLKVYSCDHMYVAYRCSKTCNPKRC